MATERTGGDNLPVPFVRPTPDLADCRFDSSFDYTGLPSKTANELFERRARIRDAAKRAIEAIIAIGCDLIAAKKILGHGRFIDWVETECRFRTRTAQNYMAISRLSTKYAFVAYLPVGTVLRLARTRGRLEFLNGILTSIDPGRRLTEDEFSALLEKFKKMRQLRPKRPGGRRPARLKPVERPSEKYSGLTKTEYSRLNAKLILDKWGFLGLLIFRLIVTSGTVDETLKFVQAEIRRLQFEHGLVDLSKSGT
jgi:hypothetical protein